ncbi:iron donor protein CyaY [Ferrigenium sp. UT5]|uniref:iron donor protein CyaY n=1 Tax=Ferrigenium sp. UT5 TaxID=3242105 RepID=UPI00355026CA
MTESEFNRLADEIFGRIERALDHGDLDYDSNGSVMEIEFQDGNKLIVNRHVPNREIWLAAKSGGFHFALHNGVWQSQRDGSELFAKLGELARLGAGVEILF